MKYFALILVCCCVFISSLHRALSLKCRTGNQQSDEQFQKIMQLCRRRVMGYERENGGNRDYNRDTDSQESSDSDSDEDVFDNKFLNSGGGRYNKNSQDKSNGGRYDNNYGTRNSSSRQGQRNWRSSSGGGNNGDQRSSMYDNYQMSSGGRRNMARNGGMDSRGSDNGYSTRYNNGNSNNYNNNNNNNMNRNGNSNGNNYNNNGDDNNGDGEREQAVDQRGFPERSSVTSIMTHSIQDPELRDFVEESVIECYHYLNNNGRQEKCQFSQNLLSCLAEKGSERCEDWDDD